MIKISKKINKCRICEDYNLIDMFDFGKIALTGTFPASKKKNINKTPLSVVFSRKSKLLQLKHNYNFQNLFGQNYGYRSGLNNSMVYHLKKKFYYLSDRIEIKPNDNILDIGSNDGTFLNFFSSNLNLIGCDPSAKKFQRFYKKNIKILYSIFDDKVINKLPYKFKLITAIAMFYDLDNPLSFLKNIQKILHKDGVFHVEIAYLPDIIKAFSFDTFCQEHLTYFSYISFKNLINQTNLRIVDYHRNSINGGSINFDLVHQNSNIKSKVKKLNNLYRNEIENGFHKVSKYRSFFKNVKKNILEINNRITKISKNKKIYGFGASTKGNVTLQVCKLDTNLISAIYDVNKEKFKKYTPGSKILIRDEINLKKDKPDYIIFLIWHFKQTIKEKFKKYKLKNTKFIWLFPKLKISRKV